VEEEEREEEELEEDTLRLELELKERDDARGIVEEGEGERESDEVEVEVEGGLETEETEPAGPLGLFTSSWVPMLMMSERVPLTKTPGDRLRSTLWEPR